MKIPEISRGQRPGGFSAQAAGTLTVRTLSPSGVTLG
jgi:hypothetical protein